MSIYAYYEMLNKSTYPLSNFDGAAVEVWE